MTSLTESIAKLICSFDGKPIPEEAIYRSKMGVLDCVGVALAGSQEPVGKVMLKYTRSLTGAAEATIWGTANKVSLQEAALVNGTMSHALDYDDMNRPMLGHPSAVLVPALIAVTEKMELSGRKLLEGYIIGLEVMARLGRIFGTQAYEKSWHPTAVLGVIGACASTGYLLRLTYEQTLNAIGIAASEASGIKKNFGSMTKPLHAGSAGRKGIWAAMLAQTGLVSDSQALDGKFGFFEMFSGKSCDLDGMNDPDRPLDIIESGLVFKQYPCCGGLHSLLDNMISLKQKHEIRPEEVKEVECRVHPRRIAYLDRPWVHEGLAAKFSIQYCVAAALLNGKVGLNDFSADSIARPETQAAMKKVRITANSDLGEFGSEVIVRNLDGKQISSKLAKARGSPDFPLSEGELLQKFADCAILAMSSAQAEKAGAALMRIDKASNLNHVIESLSSDRKI